MRDGVGGLEARPVNGAVTGLVNGSALGAAARAEASGRRVGKAAADVKAPEPEADAADAADASTAPCATHWHGKAMRDRLAAFARRFVGDAWEAEDIAQETLVRAGRSLDALRRDDRAEAWLFRICRHAAIDHVRSRRVRRGVWAPMPVDGEEWAVPAAPTADAAAPVGRAVDLRLLPAHHRLLMSLYYERGYSQATICRMTGLSASALRVRVFRARGALAAVGG
jgi:RNA polymerase sigma-70 factor (ECF subfamily)